MCAGSHEYAVPTPTDAARFFRQLMGGGLAQGMGHTLEIDFLDMQFLNVPQFREELESFPRRDRSFMSFFFHRIVYFLCHRVGILALAIIPAQFEQPVVSFWFDSFPSNQSG
jgi:hypothetical protein